MAHHHAKLIIVGSGPAGYTAAIYAARAMLEPMLISGFQPGGQLMITTDVENYPGFADVIQGPWLMEQMRLQAEHVGTRMISDHVVKVELGKRPFRLDPSFDGAVFPGDCSEQAKRRDLRRGARRHRRGRRDRDLAPDAGGGLAGGAVR